MGDVSVTIGEVLEVRDGGLGDQELLALALACAEYLPTLTPRKAVFSQDTIFVHSNGAIEVELVDRVKVEAELVPPEFDSSSNISAIQVYCLGRVLGAIAETNNADVISLLNVMTVAHIDTRPTLTRVAQIAKNKLTEDAAGILAELYFLVMGDDDEELSDEEGQGEKGYTNGDLHDLEEEEEEIGSPMLNSTKMNDVEDTKPNGMQPHKNDSNPFDTPSKDPWHMMTLSGREPFVESAPLKEPVVAHVAEEVLVAPPRRSKFLIDHSLEEDFPAELETQKRPKKRQMLLNTEDLLNPFALEDEMGELTKSGSVGRDLGAIPEAPESPEQQLPSSPLGGDTRFEKKMSKEESVFDSSLPIGGNARFEKKMSKEESVFDSPLPIGGDARFEMMSKKESVFDSLLPIDADVRVVVDEVPEPAKPAFQRNDSRTRSPIVRQSPTQPPTTSTTAFIRRNSLAANRISARKSNRSQRRGKAAKKVAMPEFIEKSELPHIRLRASITRKKKISLVRIEESDVFVVLLTGQKVEVRCRTDAIASDIFELVVAHVNLNEHSFFGLTVLRDGEHFFLDSHQRLEKFAPPGWKHERKASARNVYTLHLRLRFYPQSMDFVRTEATMHELYLQLRRDLLDERLQPRRDPVFELAALALQAEFGDRPSNPAILEYFTLEHYLPRKHNTKGEANESRTKSLLAELHSQYSGMKTLEAEHQFIQTCQRQLEYGAHFHRVFQSKPSSNLGNTPLGDPETGTAQWIAIMPRGIGVFEEESGARKPITEHAWGDTQTLQFDKKRFVIVSAKNSPRCSVFYTDHYTKSSYFVKFAASQHRFMMKMRQWSATLRSVEPRGTADVAVDPLVRRTSPAPVVDVEALFERVKPRNTPAAVLDVSVPSNDRTLPELNNNESISGKEMPEDVRENLPAASLSERLEQNSVDAEAEGVQFNVVLQKDLQLGLGLTLVDGELNGVKGVYVKSVTPNGAGQKQGLCMGDRLLSVNDVLLDGKDRHETVALVKAAGESVRMCVLRLHALANGAATQLQQTSTTSRPPSKTPSTEAPRMSRTPPPARRHAPPVLLGANRRQRAVSDFGAIGDNLPALKSDDIIAGLRRRSASSGEEDSDDGEETSRGEYRLPPSSMYRFDGSDDEDVAANAAVMQPPTPTMPQSPPDDSAGWRRPSRVLGPGRLDWTDDLVDAREQRGDTVFVRLERNAQGSLGVQIASAGGIVYVKAVTAEPALSHPEIRQDDRLVSVNGERTDNLSHNAVVEMLRNGGNTVVLGLRGQTKAPDNNEQTLTVVLDKSATGSLGLSLAKKTGQHGIFIRQIGPGSAADLDGQLAVGDRICQLDGQSIAELTPAQVIDKLKAAVDRVTITVKRTSLSQS